MNFRPRRESKPELNLIPLIDVLIVLLIFLVLTTTFSREAALHIRLPEAGAPGSEKKGVDLTIDAQGNYSVDGHRVVNSRIETLKQALKQAAGSEKDPSIVVSADKITQHQAVMSALDAASQLGFVHITFAAKAAGGEANEP